MILDLDLQFFAQDGPGGEKTEEATPKKLQDARKEGQVARSVELVNGLSLLAAFLCLKLFGGFIAKGFVECFDVFMKKIPTFAEQEFNIAAALGIFLEAVLITAKCVLPVVAACMVIGFLGNALQFSWQVTGKPLMPKFNKLNPISGFKKMFSADKLFELLKSVLKIGMIMIIVYNAVKDKWGMLLNLYDISFNTALVGVYNTVLNLAIELSALFLVIGIADFIYQKMKFAKEMRMTKQEIKDEFKQSEGDPQIKGQIRQKMREASRRRMMQELPTADVVITNPTHFAVAVRYNREQDDAPVIVAKGADYVAQTIKEKAAEYDIVIVENKPLARMLYFNVEIGEQIPPELYQMVADVLVYVYKVKNRTLEAV